MLCFVGGIEDRKALAARLRSPIELAPHTPVCPHPFVLSMPLLAVYAKRAFRVSLSLGVSKRLS
jgi:hypothetical protein